MSGTLTLQLIANLVNGSHVEQFNPGQLSLTQTNQGAAGGVVTVGSGAEEDLATGDLSTPGILVLQNLDDTNFVSYGPKDSGSMVAFGKLVAGDVHFLRLASTVTLRWQADTADVKVRVWLLET